MKKGKKEYTKGFTLIELLVVIAIIAILSTVVMAGLNSARAKGRDAKRLSDIKQLQTALELFFDTCGGYPTPTGDTDAGLGVIHTDTGNYPQGLAGDNNHAGTVVCTGHTVREFMDPLPENPRPNGTTYRYCSASMSATLPAANTALSAANCTQDASASYRIEFSLEGQSGSLPSGYHIASPSGII